MRLHNPLIHLVMGVTTLAVVGCQQPQRVTTQSLLHQMTDLARLTERPQPAFMCRQFSSYDRRSVSPEDHDAWFANYDRGHYLAVEERAGRKEHVMVDVDGPGALVRIWSADPKGTLRIYLDHAEEPVIEAPMADLLGGKHADFPTPLSYTASAGWNLYFPIAYAEHCKVTSDQGGFYYLVNYRTYTEGTEVETFTVQDLDRLRSDIAAVASLLDDPPTKPLAHTHDDFATKPHGARIAPGQTLEWKPARTASGAIYELRARVDGAENAAQALRKLVLRLTFDGQTTVLCPLSDFFGGGPGTTPYTSLPMGVSPEGEFWSHWIMPYARRVEAAIHNRGDEPVRLHFSIVTGDYRWTRRSMHFHAGWRVARDVPSRPFIDWNYITIDGTGVFVGAAYSLANPVRNWWGEGDEKIYIDGEEFPSHFGTGTEDYFGYAWCSNQPFQHAYHNQPRCDGPINYGRTAVNRWHIIDCIPFDSHFEFDMEFWHSNNETRVPEMSATTYWYARPGATSNRAELDADDLKLVQLGAFVAPRVKGALEGEELQATTTAGLARSQDIMSCSNDRHLWWTGGEPGDTLTLTFPSQVAGRHEVLVRLVRSGDYGIVRFRVNGQPTGDPIDLFSKDHVRLTDEINLGTFDLVRGDNQLAVEIVGKHDDAVPGYMCGIDYVRLVPAE